MSSCAYIAYRIGQHHAVVAARASSPAGIASTERTARRQKRVDFAAGYCGLSPPTLFERIGIMAADDQPLPTRFDTARLKRARRSELARRMALAKPSSRPITTYHFTKQGMNARAGPFT